MDKHSVTNFLGLDPINVSSMQARFSAVAGYIPALVQLTQSAGSLSMCHSMTTAQARQLADALIAHADALDGVEVVA